MYFDLSIHNFVHESLFHKETNKFSSGNKQLFHPRPLMKNKSSQKKKNDQESYNKLPMHPAKETSNFQS